MLVLPTYYITKAIGDVMAIMVLHNYLRSTENAKYCPKGFSDSTTSSGDFIPGDWKALIIPQIHLWQICDLLEALDIGTMLFLWETASEIMLIVRQESSTGSWTMLEEHNFCSLYFIKVIKIYYS